MYENYKKLLKEFVALKSVSTDTAFKGEMIKTVTWLENLLKKGGATVELWKGKNSNPTIFATLGNNKKLPTVLIYGHYDVQPAEKADGWKSEPFTLTETKGKLIARGVVDNKGQILTHIVTALDLYKRGTLGYNVKFVIEGNEESGNPDIAGQLKKNKKALACDMVVISDGEIAGKNPTLEASLRGGGNIKVVYETAPSDLHSGLYGGSIPSASHELSKMLATLKDINNKVCIKGFYDGALKIDKKHVINNSKLGTHADFIKLAGVQSLCTEKVGKNMLDPWTQVGLRPTLEISGISSGYTGNGFKNIVPAKAEARINIRTVYPQKTKEVFALVVDYIKKSTPSYVKVKIETEEHGNPIWLDTETRESKHVMKLLEQSHQKEVLTKYVGGSIPIVADFTEILGKQVLLVSLGNDDCNMHGLNENYSIDLIKKGLKFSELFLSGK